MPQRAPLRQALTALGAVPMLQFWTHRKHRLMTALAAASATAPQLISLALIRKLVSFDTTSRNSNLALIDWVRDYLAEYGIGSDLTFNDDRSKANLFATLPAQDGTTASGGIVLSGHSDVVPVDGQPWDTNPFEATLIGDKLYGRGVSDMKSFSAIGLAFVPEFIRRGLKRPLHLALSYDEEVGCIGVRRLVNDIMKRAVKPAGCIVGEPTGMRLVIAHKGKKSYRCRVRGHEAHSSLTPRGVNAVHVTAEIIGCLTQMAAVSRAWQLRCGLRRALHHRPHWHDPRRHRTQHRAAQLRFRIRNSTSTVR